jgi:hypothetical protein
MGALGGGWSDTVFSCRASGSNSYGMAWTPPCEVDGGGPVANGMPTSVIRVRAREKGDANRSTR